MVGGGAVVNAYDTLVSEAQRQNMPEAFKDDLAVHDRNRLAIPDAPDRFGWVLRLSGTLLLDARIGAKDRRAYLDHVLTSGRCEGDRCYFWDGTALAHVTAEEMGRLMQPHEVGGHACY